MELKLLELIPDHKYFAKHIPSNEDWVVLGISKDAKHICAAGWPPTIANYADMVFYEDAGKLKDEEIKYRNKVFGENWL